MVAHRRRGPGLEIIPISPASPVATTFSTTPEKIACSALTMSKCVVIGTLTLTGSFIAFGKLQGFVSGKPIVYPAQQLINGIMIVALRRVHSVTSRRQLRWVVSGAVLGGVPFALSYGIPYSVGFAPAAGLEFTAIALGLIPLAFASAIVRYRLRDVEVIVKRSLVYSSVVVAMVLIYLVLEGLATAVFLEESDGHNAIIALLATAVVVLLARPVKNTIQTMLDRVYYRDRFDYRRALVRFARDLSTDLDLQRLSTRLVSRVSETFDVDRMVLFLGQDFSPNTEIDAGKDYRPIRWRGFEDAPPPLKRSSSVGERMANRHMVLLDDSVSRRNCSPTDVEFWREQEIFYFVPCVVEEGPIAVMALGRKGSGEPLSSEDMALLTTVAGQVATGLENGRLYGQLQEKASREIAILNKQGLILD